MRGLKRPIVTALISPFSNNSFENAISTSARLMLPCFLAIGFMHCKNVELRKISDPIKVAKKFKKKHNQPLARYHVLEIEPMKKILRSEGQADKVGLKKAMHICRGHFKDYRQRGLFGRQHGVFWWDHHTRGTKARGLVFKDYDIKSGS